MRKFLRKTSSFITILLVLGCLARVVNQELLRYQGPTWDQSVETLLIGDSHIQRGVDPEFIPGSRNVAISAEPLMITFYKLKWHLEHSPGLSRVVLGLGPHNLAPFNDLKLDSDQWAPEMVRRYYGLQPWWHIRGVGFSVGTIVTGEARWLWTPNGHLIKNFMHHRKGKTLQEAPFIGGFETGGESGLEPGALRAVLHRHFQPTPDSQWVSKIQEGYVRRIVKLVVEEHGLDLIFLSTPTHPRYRTAIPDPLRNRHELVWNELTSKAGVFGLDYSSLDVPENAYRDFDHVSPSGARLISSMINDEFEVLAAH